jgi:Ca-activated chloride channel homolog
LMTDGQNNSGSVDPLTAAQAAQALGVKVYTIGVSKNGMAPMPVGKNPFTGETVYQMEPVDVDETTLKQIAQMTGGQYYRADNAQKFKQIYAEINKLEKTEEVVNKFTQYTELFPWLVSCGFVLLLLEITLGQTVFRKLP